MEPRAIESTPKPSPAQATPDSVIRRVGALVGGGVALVAMGFLYLASSVPELEQILLTRTILDGDAIGVTGFGTVIGWTVAPAAGAIAGWHRARWAVAGDRWAGVGMGFLTYAIAIFVAPLAVALAVATTTPSLSASGGPSSLDFMAGYIVAAPMLWIVAAGLLTPMLLVCATCGAAWAGVLRRVFPRIPAPADGRRATWPGRVLLAILVALSVCWLGLAAILSSLQTEFVD